MVSEMKTQVSVFLIFNTYKCSTKGTLTYMDLQNINNMSNDNLYRYCRRDMEWQGELSGCLNVFIGTIELFDTGIFRLRNLKLHPLKW